MSPERMALTGKWVYVAPLSVSEHADSLWAAVEG